MTKLLDIEADFTTSGKMSHFNFYYSSIFPAKAVRIPQAILDVADTEKQITYNKNTVTAAFRLARLEITEIEK